MIFIKIFAESKNHRKTYYMNTLNYQEEMPMPSKDTNYSITWSLYQFITKFISVLPMF